MVAFSHPNVYNIFIERNGVKMSKCNQHHLRAIIYDKRGRILSIGENSYLKTHRVMYSLGKAVGKPSAIFLHAEVDAIVKCREIHNAHRIVVMRFTPSGYRLAKPCDACMKGISTLTPIKIIEWTTNDLDDYDTEVIKVKR